MVRGALRYRVLLLLLCVVFPAFLPVRAQQQRPAEKRLRYLIDDLITSGNVPKHSVGIQVVSLTDGRELYALNAHKLFSPASTMKLVTMAAALDWLGPEFQWKTEVWHDGQISENGVLEGNVYVKGFGNPYFMEEDMAGIARFVSSFGIRSIHGNVYYDDSYFDDKRLGPGVSPASTQLYDPRQTALAYNFNQTSLNILPGAKPGAPAEVYPEPPSSFVSITNKVRTSSANTRLSAYPVRNSTAFVVSGSISIDSPLMERYFKINEPEAYFAGAFMDKLQLEGIACAGKPAAGRVVTGDPSLKHIGTHLSPPLVELLWLLGKKSNNFVADQVFTTLGAERYGSPASFVKGSMALSSYLKELGHDPADFLILDGSGLSRENRLSPAVLLSVLKNVYDSDRLRPAFVESLAWSGLDGTLGDRLVNEKTVGRIFAKTGSLAGVSALSGYVSAYDSGDLAFSIVFNGGIELRRAKRIEDAIVRILTEN